MIIVLNLEQRSQYSEGKCNYIILY